MRDATRAASRRKRRMTDSRPAYPLLDPTLDIVFRRFFADEEAKDLLIDFLTAVLKPSKPIVDIEPYARVNEDKTATEKEVVLDLVVTLDGGDRVNLEMQCRLHDAFGDRIVFYGARVVGSSLARGADYASARRAIFVGVLRFVWREQDPFHFTARMRPDTSPEPISDLFEAHFIQLPKIREILALDEGAAERQDPLIRWCRFLLARSDDERRALAQEAPIMRRAHERLEQLSADPEMQVLAQIRADRIALETMHEKRALDAVAAQSKAEGKAEGKASALSIVLVKRFGMLDDSTRVRIAAASLEELDRWFDASLDAPSLEAVFDPI